jgi:hypothetical protein
MNTAFCPACASALDHGDNFCRRCGSATAPASLPAIRRASSAVVWQPQVSPVVKGAAVMAAGTLGQFVLRRALGSLLGGGANRQKPRGITVRSPRERDGMIDEAQVITETIMMRRVRIRRQA